MDVTGGQRGGRVSPAGLAVLVALVLLPACAGGGDAPLAASSTTRATVVDDRRTTTTDDDTPRTTLAVPAGPCSLGPPATEITFVVGDKLIARSPEAGPAACRAGVSGSPFNLVWGGAADRVLLGDQVLTAQRAIPAKGDSLSRPTGTATLRIEGTRLIRHPLDAKPIDVTFLENTTEAIYHPAGLHIVAIGELGGQVGIYIATNTGANAAPLVRGESNQRGGLHDLAWDENGDLDFIADHDGRTHVHRVRMADLALTELAGSQDDLTMLVVSAFDDSAAWRSGTCAVEVRVGSDRQRLASAGRPVGWLPDGRLVTGPDPDCTKAPPLRVWNLKGSNLLRPRAKTIWSGAVVAAAVRVVLPSPPKPPPSAPASAGPA